MTFHLEFQFHSGSIKSSNGNQGGQYDLLVSIP